MMKHLAIIALAAAALAACEQDRGVTNPASGIESALEARRDHDQGDDLEGPRAVYTLTNQVAGNAVAAFNRAADGTLSAAGTIATGGTGVGAGLGSQGAVALSDDGRWLFAVNAGSNDVSVLRVRRSGLSLASRTASGGTMPISLTVRGNVLYVLNAGGAGNITGFTVGEGGGLHAIRGSTRSLSGSGVGPAQVSFSPDGRSLFVTEKTANLIEVYSVGRGGVTTERASAPSAGATPFGFAFGRDDELLVSEASGSASSYELGRHGGLTVVSGAVLTHQGAPCWLVVTSDGRFAYTGNAQGGSISGFAVARNGSISLLDADGATARVGPGATDLALSGGSRYLYELVRSNIFAFRIQADGHLAPLGPVGGLPAGTVGLAAR